MCWNGSRRKVRAIRPESTPCCGRFVTHRFNWSAHTDTQNKVAAARRMVERVNGDGARTRSATTLNAGSSRFSTHLARQEYLRGKVQRRLLVRLWGRSSAGTFSRATHSLAPTVEDARQMCLWKSITARPSRWEARMTLRTSSHPARTAIGARARIRFRVESIVKERSNPSSDATNNSVQRLRTFPNAMPLLFALHRKRYAFGGSSK